MEPPEEPPGGGGNPNQFPPAKSIDDGGGGGGGNRRRGRQGAVLDVFDTRLEGIIILIIAVLFYAVSQASRYGGNGNCTC
mmetsp:Transcript_1487/g.3020  ORF Transcript_1487/g.3020 Transcript_1487/m.3020 type:complete len:80 (+) Transcript_1487:37-276(+)